MSEKEIEESEIGVGPNTIKKRQETFNKSDIFEKNDNAPLGFQIKRIHAKQVEHKSKLLLPGSNRIIICGGSGRGKSTIVLQILVMFTNNTTHLIIASVKAQDDAFDAIEKYCKYMGIKFIQLNNSDDTAGAIQEIVNNKKEEDHYVVIFDDLATAYSSSSKDPTNNMITTAYSLLRSTNGSLIMVTQSYNNIPTRVRLNTNMKIVFAMDDIYSSRSVIDDTVGMFFSGEDEKIIRKDIKEIYKKLYDDFHNFIIILNNPPSIRMNWNTILYPKQLEGNIVGGEIGELKRKKKPMNNGILNKRALYRKARDLGFPVYAYRTCNVQQLEEYISKKIKKEPIDIEEIVGKGLGDAHLVTRLNYFIRMYRAKKNPATLYKISETCEKIVEKKLLPEQKIKYLLKSTGMDKYISLGNDE